ncbi:MAG: N-acetylglucosamine-6-phosphate deacetylase [Caldilineaceae bacterium]|nr:N-acetylglucosamine-6-phosphate deacetylase [Caldilineaceae bacterium]
MTESNAWDGVQLHAVAGGSVYGTAIPDDPTTVSRDPIFIVGDHIATEGDTRSHRGEWVQFEADELHVLPGFVDVHVHGGGGHDAMSGNPDDIQGMGRFHARHGTTALTPTTGTAPKDTILNATRAIGEAMTRPARGARIVGAHIEGPFINPAWAGAQNPAHIVDIDMRFVQQLAATDAVKLMTFAPELPGGGKLTKELLRLGIVPVMGHTGATWAQTVAAANMGVVQATHTYNAMLGLHHREPGALGRILLDDRIQGQLIADNVHVHPGAMDLLWRCKGPLGVMLITDAIRAVGLPEGQYDFGRLPVTVKDGACRLPDGTLAGSIATMNACLRNLMDATGLDLAEVWQASSLVPAGSLKLDHAIGHFATGCMADIAIVDNDINVAATIVGGRVQYLASVYADRISGTQRP